MPFAVKTSSEEVPSPSDVQPDQVREMAKKSGDPRHSEAVAVTVPIIRIDQTGLSYETKTEKGKTEFRFDDGTLKLTLRQKVYMSNALSECEKRIWLNHEMLHVKDNEDVMTKMDENIRKDAKLKAIFITRDWFPRDKFDEVQKTIQTRVGEIFRKLTMDAIAARDTSEEYKRVSEEIRRKCHAAPGPPTLAPGPPPVR